MSFRSWVYVFAIIGLTVSAEAQQQAESPGYPTANQSKPTEDLSGGGSIKTVGDYVGTESRQAREREREEREKEDLIAQQRMAVATEAMNEATQSMKQAAWFSFWAIALGTGLLFWTLGLTRSANRSAQEGVLVTRTMMQEQIRAYVTVIEVGEGARCEFSYRSNVLSVEINFTNLGGSPASNVVFNGIFLVKIGKEVIGWSQHVDMHGGMAPKGSASISWDIKSFDRKRFESAESANLTMTGRFHYFTHFGDYGRTGISIEGVSNLGSIEDGWAYKTSGNELT